MTEYPGDDQSASITPSSPNPPIYGGESAQIPRGLAIAALVVGGFAFLTGWVPVFGLVVGATALVLGILALKRGQSKPMSIAGLVLGGLAVLASLVTTALLVFGSNDLAEGFADATSSPSASATEEVAEMVEVPDVNGMTVREAILAVKDVELTTDPTGAGVNDIVTGSEPAAGAKVEAGSTVSITADAPTATVPDVIGMTVLDAYAALADVGLSGDSTGSSRDGIVTSADPAAGTLVELGSYVMLTWETPPADLSKFATLSAREFGLIGKNPEAHVGEQVILYGDIFQFDSFTGACSFMANTGNELTEYTWEYSQNTAAYAGDGDSECPALDEILQGDVVKMWVTVKGSYDYETQIGGNTTALLLEVAQIELVPAG